MSKKRKPNKRSKRSRQERSERVVMVTGIPGSEPKVVSSELTVAPMDLDVYMFSHYLLPACMQECEYGTMPPSDIFADAVATLAGENRDSSEVLGAIAVLGHSPCVGALEALRGYIDAQKTYDGVAEVALCECIDLLGMVTRTGDAKAS